MSQRKVILSMQMSIDGYVAPADEKLNWIIGSEEEWRELFKELEEADTYLLGRKMYPDYSQHWQSVLKSPDAKGGELGFAKLAEKTQHIVFTNGDFKPDWKNTKVAHDLPGEIAMLKKQSGKNMIAWGGANFASNLINLGLVDEIRIALNPTVLGGGKPMFGNMDHRRKLELIDSRPLKSGLVIVRYRAS
jgi:dihydrofolate reductase